MRLLFIVTWKGAEKITKVASKMNALESLMCHKCSQRRKEKMQNELPGALKYSRTAREEERASDKKC